MFLTVYQGISCSNFPYFIIFFLNQDINWNWHIRVFLKPLCIKIKTFEFEPFVCQTSATFDLNTFCLYCLSAATCDAHAQEHFFLLLFSWIQICTQTRRICFSAPRLWFCFASAHPEPGLISLRSGRPHLSFGVMPRRQIIRQFLDFPSRSISISDALVAHRSAESDTRTYAHKSKRLHTRPRVRMFFLRYLCVASGSALEMPSEKSVSRARQWIF